MTPVHSLKNEWHQREQKAFGLGSDITDKHGVEIYEGDRVQLSDGKAYVVTVNDGGFWIGDAPLLLFKGDCEVVGHIEEDES